MPDELPRDERFLSSSSFLIPLGIKQIAAVIAEEGRGNLQSLNRNANKDQPLMFKQRKMQRSGSVIFVIELRLYGINASHKQIGF